jgi:2,4-diaminopentanoate dehydrogenase
MKKLRVVHWGTGQVGREALRAVLTHPQLELVGHFVFNNEKLGKDSGELCGLDAAGITTTNDLDDLLAKNADCLTYFGDGTRPEWQRAGCEVAARFLERGTNVVTSALLPLLYEPVAPADLLAIVKPACEIGQSSLYVGGIDPGYGTTGLALGTLSLATEVRKVWVREIADYSHFPYIDALARIFGFGQPMSFCTEDFDTSWVQRWWKGTVAALADAIGVTIEEYRTFFEPVSHTEDIDTGWIKIPAGTVAGARYGIEGIVGGQPVIIFEHITRMRPDVAPQWMTPSGMAGQTIRHQYRCDVEGRPNLSCAIDMNVTSDGADDAIVASAGPLVNAIPWVCAAAPGLINPLDLPNKSTRNFQPSIDKI